MSTNYIKVFCKCLSYLEQYEIKNIQISFVIFFDKFINLVLVKK